jgi:hypothetical protein
MASTFFAYVDESGDEGFRFGNGCSDWLVLSAVVSRRAGENHAQTVHSIKDDCCVHRRKVLHVRRLSLEHKTTCVTTISKANIRVISVLVHKPSLLAPETFQSEHRLYFYAARYLIERISWCCRDHRRPTDKGDGTVQVIFGRRDGLPYIDLQAYMARLETQGTAIDWSVIRPDQVSDGKMNEYHGLQLADAVAHSFFCAVEESRPSIPCEPSLARILRPVVYHRTGTYHGYGLMAFPVRWREVAFLKDW